mmetsp:Transcript_41651/g.111681  ORF Transcript_41651/g.111681 Transcript_41651/m.111681 type:complete len:255 (+) Transcript_41651:784-1548(+)
MHCRSDGQRRQATPAGNRCVQPAVTRGRRAREHCAQHAREVGAVHPRLKKRESKLGVGACPRCRHSHRRALSPTPIAVQVRVRHDDAQRARVADDGRGHRQRAFTAHNHQRRGRTKGVVVGVADCYYLPSLGEVQPDRARRQGPCRRRHATLELTRDSAPSEVHKNRAVPGPCQHHCSRGRRQVRSRGHRSGGRDGSSVGRVGAPSCVGGRVGGGVGRRVRRSVDGCGSGGGGWGQEPREVGVCYCDAQRGVFP